MIPPSCEFQQRFTLYLFADVVSRIITGPNYSLWFHYRSSLRRSTKNFAPLISRIICANEAHPSLLYCRIYHYDKSISLGNTRGRDFTTCRQWEIHHRRRINPFQGHWLYYDGHNFNKDHLEQFTVEYWPRIGQNISQNLYRIILS